VAKITAKLEGYDATQRALVKAPELTKVFAAEAVAKSTFSLEQRARALAPRGLTGRLRKAITSKASATAGRIGIAGGYGLGGKTKGPETYWIFVEFGTVRKAARPFFRPAAEAEKADYLKRLRDIGPKLERDLAAGRTL
jgi:HK97 gp10 family phage protein